MPDGQPHYLFLDNKLAAALCAPRHGIDTYADRLYTDLQLWVSASGRRDWYLSSPHGEIWLGEFPNIGHRVARMAAKDALIRQILASKAAPLVMAEGVDETSKGRKVYIPPGFRIL